MMLDMDELELSNIFDNGLTYEYIIDNKKQPNISNFYINIDFRNEEHKYNSLDQIFYSFEFGYYFRGQYTSIVNLLPSILMYKYEKLDYNLCDIIKNVMINYDAISYIPLQFFDNKNDYIPTNDDSFVIFSIKIMCRVKLPIKLYYSFSNIEISPTYSIDYFEYSLLKDITIDTETKVIRPNKYIPESILEYLIDFGKKINNDVKTINGGHHHSSQYILCHKYYVPEIILNDNHSMKTYKIFSRIKKKLNFIDGHITDGNNNKLTLKDDDIYDDLDDDNIKLTIDI